MQAETTNSFPFFVSTHVFKSVHSFSRALFWFHNFLTIDDRSIDDAIQPAEKGDKMLSAAWSVLHNKIFKNL